MTPSRRSMTAATERRGVFARRNHHVLDDDERRQPRARAHSEPSCWTTLQESCVTGNPEDGWTLENWDGVEVSADPSLPTKLFVDVRNVVTAPQTAAFRIRQAFVPKVVNDVRGSAAVQSDEQAPSTQTALNAAINKRSLRSVKGSADEPAAEAPKTTRLAKKTEKPNGAMNLTRVETSFTRAMPLPQAATRPGRTKPRVRRPTTTRATAPTRRPPDAAH